VATTRASGADRRPRSPKTSRADAFPLWRPRSIAALRIAFGVVFAVDAWFKWQQAFVHGFTVFTVQASGTRAPLSFQ